MSLLFNTLSKFIIAFLPRSNRLLISWLQSPSAVSSVLCQIPPLCSSKGQRFPLSSCEKPWLTTHFPSEFQAYIYPWKLVLYSLLMINAVHFIILDIRPRYITVLLLNFLTQSPQVSCCSTCLCQLEPIFVHFKHLPVFNDHPLLND